MPLRAVLGGWRSRNDLASLVIERPLFYHPYRILLGRLTSVTSPAWATTYRIPFIGKLPWKQHIVSCRSAAPKLYISFTTRYRGNSLTTAFLLLPTTGTEGALEIWELLTGITFASKVGSADRRSYSGANGTLFSCIFRPMR